ncbi:hypothetical protein SUGI_0749500 [Cryptomeria japonica]|uniref:phospholipase A1 PLIP2, chloroplastic n=1 Tax=Cryptomeria japonica TaxID=3369 RepID=UPI0024147191|nr:phospholipase A1 PLIP2, chloroplastic [Cryptomeria japonica]GLJ36997.1 hypothetical protein SUGI_0749500 [Cryptomeria japonica]
MWMEEINGASISTKNKKSKIGTGIGGEAGTGTKSRDNSIAKSVPFQLGSKCEAKFKSCKKPESFPPISPFFSPPLLFPVPLKFIWINKTNEEDVEGGDGPELNADGSRKGFNSSTVKNPQEIDKSDAEEEEEEENDGKYGLLSAEDSLKEVAEKNPIKLNATYDNSGAQGNQGKCISPNDGNEPENPDDSDRAGHANWVGRIIEFGSYWKEEKKCDQNSSSNGASSSKTEPCLPQQGDSSSEMSGSNSDSNHPDHGSKCQDDFLCYLRKQESINEVTYDRDSFSRLLHPVSLPEMKVYAQMAFLCDQAYSIPQIKPAKLWKLYRLRYVTSSLDKTTETIANVVSSRSTANAELQSSIPSETEGESNSRSRGKGGNNSRLSLSPSVAYEMAASAASYIHSQTKYILPFKSERRNPAENDENLNTGTKQDAIADTDNNQKDNETEKDAEDASVEQRAPNINNTQQRYIASQQAEPSKLSGIPKSEMAAIVATSSVTALVAAEDEAKQAAARDLQSSHSPPLCEWFICDDDSSYTRYFVIKGSDSFASWQANLFFEPMQFEGFEVLIHRGIYEAAKGMYEQLLPEILSHLRRHGEKAQFQFTGHSLGGSLSLLLNLMLLIKGVVLITSLLPVITFGSPCVMCGGNYLLQKLGLPNHHVQAVMMHRDIVPRSFACNYPNHVAEVLKRLNFSFQDHPCLNFQNFLYGSTGQLLILQPDEKISPPHPLLASGCGFYRLHHVKQDGNEHENELSGTLQAEAAQSAFLNTPHPLEILSDRSAYGSEGSIARDHNSINYFKVINYILRQQIKHLRKLRREQRRQVWSSLVTADSPKSSQKPFKVAKENKMSEDLTGTCK